MEVVPYDSKTKGKKEQVAEMFDNISPKYDFLNHFLSLGIDVIWRRKAIGELSKDSPREILDIATGTGDFAIEALRLNPEKVIGIDISQGMLSIGRDKIKKKGLENRIQLLSGDSEMLPFDDSSFDAVIVAFGVRNFENLRKGLSEIHRVLRTGGKVVILEFSKPTVFPLRDLYNFYFRYVLPKIGRLVSSDNSAYTYLPESVQAFPDGKDFLAILSETGFKDEICKKLTFGISSIYVGCK